MALECLKYVDFSNSFLRNSVAAGYRPIQCLLLLWLQGTKVDWPLLPGGWESSQLPDLSLKLIGNTIIVKHATCNWTWSHYLGTGSKCTESLDFHADQADNPDGLAGLCPTP